jgi:hypothetical protein
MANNEEIAGVPRKYYASIQVCLMQYKWASLKENTGHTLTTKVTSFEYESIEKYEIWSCWAGC